MSEGSLLGPRESAARALMVYTLVAESGVKTDDQIEAAVEEIAGETYEELLDAAIAVAGIGLAAMELLTPDDPLAMIRELGKNLDRLPEVREGVGSD